jgi:hypothetical protein
VPGQPGASAATAASSASSTSAITAADPSPRRSSLAVGAKRDVARQEHPDRRIGRDRAMGQRRVARPEDEVRLAVDVEPRLHRRLDIDLGQDAESLGAQGGLDARTHGADRLAQAGGKRVAGLGGHGDPPVSDATAL